MQTITKTYKVYEFKELSDEAKEKALQDLCDLNTDYDWWQSIYEDAERIGLKITSFALDRNRHAEGAFISYGGNVARTILKEHGKKCTTYEAAIDFLSEIEGLDEESEDYGDAEDEFLKSILEDYSIILQQKCDYLTSEKAIIETIEANDYDFLENGTFFTL